MVKMVKLIKLIILLTYHPYCQKPQRLDARPAGLVASSLRFFLELASLSESRQSCFVSGHDFSRAVPAATDEGFSPWGRFITVQEGQLVRKGGLEPPWVAPPDPKSGASANFATFAFRRSRP